jgi:N-methylhydantoinase B
MSAGQMPDRIEQLVDGDGRVEYLPPKAFHVVQNPDDVFVLSWASAGGYGDPLLRDPERVAEDYREGRLTREWAQRAYGVVLDDEGAVLWSETERLREELRRRRIGADPKPQTATDEPDARLLAEGMKLVGGWIHCRYCHHRLSPLTENYKLHCLRKAFPVQEANPHILDPRTYIEEDIEWRHFYCPGCGALLQTELARPSDEPLWDIRLDLRTV